MKVLSCFFLFLWGCLIFQIHGMEQQPGNPYFAKILVAFTDTQRNSSQEVDKFLCYCLKLYNEQSFKTHVLSRVFFPLNVLDQQLHAQFIYYQNLDSYKVATFIQGKNSDCPVPACKVHSNNPIVTFNHIINVHTDLKKIHEHFTIRSMCWCGSHHN